MNYSVLKYRVVQNIHYIPKSKDKYENKYVMLLKKLNQEDKANEVQELIERYEKSKQYKAIEIRDDLAQIIKETS